MFVVNKARNFLTGRANTCCLKRAPLHVVEKARKEASKDDIHMKLFVKFLKLMFRKKLWNIHKT
jgi:hypothetical protein